jgi:hypothetical protein
MTTSRLGAQLHLYVPILSGYEIENTKVLQELPDGTFLEKNYSL